MVTFERSPSRGYELVDEWERGIGWLAHPDESGARTSHALTGMDSNADDLWLFDPLDAPGIDAELASLGEVAGVVVCSSFHARDADRFATRHDVPIYAPSWLGRLSNTIDAPLERFDGELDTAGFLARRLSPFPTWSEAILYRPTDRTLYVPDVLGTASSYLSGDERLAFYLFCRPSPPVSVFEDLEPERIVVGHGTGIFEDATATLEAAIETARRGFPRALATNGPAQLRSALAALR